MERIFNYVITEATEHVDSIQMFLKSLGYSHGLLAHLKRTHKGIQKNGEWTYVNQPLKVGDVLTVTLVESKNSNDIVPVKLPLNIVYEDEDLMVIDKPSNMPIHPSQGNYENTLANAVTWYFKEKQQDFVYRCINRLDRDTTGLLIIAKHSYSAALLSNMIAHRKISREYLAIVTGDISEFGTITAPIARVEGSTIEREVNMLTGEYACTHYKKLSYKNGYSLVSITLETGRTHQIRVHMKYVNHPLPGDFLYNPDYSFIERQALHSHKLTFKHPITNESMEFISPLPDDMALII